ncbi:dihydrofolate reductase family protein [Myroides injenensis]|uniref:dihydrofolate reductase family protein n=1 Tax=Myroides injenensis TaxID=1183151 RepID=UPI0002894224|nr:dihydrofolate reductase [Myroides injenensis]
MKIALIANISINGKVLVSDNPLYQLPTEALTFYLDIAHQIGNLVIGFNTFKSFQNSPQEVKALFKGIEIIVLSTNQNYSKDGYTFVSSPEEVIAYMTTKGITELAIGGGTSTFNAFIDQELVTDLYLNINPLIIGESDVLGVQNNLGTKFNIVTHKEHNGFIELHFTRSKN